VRVLVGQLNSESNSHNPVPTTLRDFAVVAAEDVVATFSGGGSTLGGFLDRLRGRDIEDVEIVTTLAAHARPGGPVEPGTYRTLSGSILGDAERYDPDIVLLDLHGSMLTATDTDPDGTLLAGLRSRLRPGSVVGVGLDLHANVTTRMLDNADVLVGCKTNPHADLRETGRRVADLALWARRTGQTPDAYHVRIPLVLTGNNETHRGPLAGAHTLARRLETVGGVLDVSIFNTHPMVDAPQAGQLVSALTTGPADGIDDSLVEIASLLWAARDAFVHDFGTAEETLASVAARTADGPWVMSDYGDRVLAGAPGDSTEILELLLSGRYPMRAVVPVTDPVAAATAHAAGIGATVTLRVGGGFTPGFEPVEVSGRVRHLSDGRFRVAGPLYAGQPSIMGDTAVVDLGSVTLLITSVPALTQDTAAFTSQGIDPADFDLVVVKSGNHFQLSFDNICRPVKALTRGLGAYVPGAFEYRHRGPVHPESEVAFTPRVISRRAVAG
jgi:microcystin degradation protein MlrC